MNPSAEPRPMPAAQLVTCLRRDGPPLRFKGHRVTHWDKASSDTTQLFVSLWSREAGGMVIAYSAWTGADWRPDAQKVATLEDAIVALEGICTDLVTAIPALPPISVGLADRLHSIAGHSQDIHDFKALAGKALADWFDLGRAGCETEQN